MEVKTADGTLRVTMMSAELLVRAHEKALRTPQKRPAEWRPELAEPLRRALTLLPVGHPVAPVAWRLCQKQDHTPPQGAVACGNCWEQAIRTDQRVVTEEGLPASQERYLDEVAIQQFIEGDDNVPLTELERNEAASRLYAAGHEPSTISVRLGENLRRACERLGLDVQPAAVSSIAVAAETVQVA